MNQGKSYALTFSGLEAVAERGGTLILNQEQAKLIRHRIAELELKVVWLRNKSAAWAESIANNDMDADVADGVTVAGALIQEMVDAAKGEG